MPAEHLTPQMFISSSISLLKEASKEGINLSINIWAILISWFSAVIPHFNDHQLFSILQTMFKFTILLLIASFFVLSHYSYFTNQKLLRSPRLEEQQGVPMTFNTAQNVKSFQGGDGKTDVNKEYLSLFIQLFMNVILLEKKQFVVIKAFF